MMKPHTRQDLLIAARTRYDELWHQIDALPADDKTKDFPFEGRDRNLRDVLVHLSGWQELYLRWSKTNLAGEKRVRFLPHGYTWATCGKLSRKLRDANQKLSLDNAEDWFRKTHAEMIAQFEELEQEQLFVPGFYSWTGTNTLGDYATLFSVTRYHWAEKVVRHYRHTLTPVTQ